MSDDKRYEAEQEMQHEFLFQRAKDEMLYHNELEKEKISILRKIEEYNSEIDDILSDYPDSIKDEFYIKEQ